MTKHQADRFFGQVGVAQSGGQVRYECPKCTKNLGKLHLWCAIDRGMFICFKCRYKGKINAGGAVSNKKVEAKKLISKAVPLVTTSKLGMSAVCYLTRRGVTEDRAEELGIRLVTTGPHKGRLFLPVHEDGGLVYYVLRATDARTPKERGPLGHSGYAPRREVVFGIDSVKRGKRLFLVEGIFDAENLRRLGYDAVALLGCHMTDEQIGKVLSRGPSEIYFMFDGDDAGIFGASESAVALRKRFKGTIRVVCLPQGKDPDELTGALIRHYVDNKARIVL